MLGGIRFLKVAGQKTSLHTVRKASGLPQLLDRVETELVNIKEAGLWKHERVISTKQGLSFH